MFPPLCFVDESKAEVEYDKTEKIINSKKNNLSLDVGLNSEEKKSEELVKQEDKGKNENEVKIKFKIVEILKNLFN